MYTSAMMAELHDYMVRCVEEAYDEHGYYIEEDYDYIYGSYTDVNAKTSDSADRCTSS
jgi:hypothetical protein